MMGVSGDLYRAANGLRKAAEATLTGNSYYQAANRIAAFIELLGPAEEAAAPGEDNASDLATMLIDLRKEVGSHLSDNRYYMAVNRLEELASFLTPRAEALAPRKLSFDELAAASKARAAAAAASLGIATAHQAVPHRAQSAGTLADGELERRSSEPCLMAELAPPVEPVAAAPIFAQAAAPAPLEKTSESLGPSAAQGELGAIQGTAPSAAAAHPPAAPAFQASAPAYDSEAPSASQTVEAAARTGAPETPAPVARQEIKVKESGEIKRKEPKTLFKLWLDLAFGRKD